MRALALTVIGDLARAGLVLDHGELVAGLGRRVEAEDLDRDRRARARRRCSPSSSISARTRPQAVPATTMSPTLQRAALDQRGADGTAAALELGLDDHAFGGALGIGLEVEHFGLQRDRFQQLVEAGRFSAETSTSSVSPPHALDDDLVLQQLGAHALRVGAGLVDLVDGHDDRHAGRLGVIDRPRPSAA